MCLRHVGSFLIALGAVDRKHIVMRPPDDFSLELFSEPLGKAVAYLRFLFDLLELV